MIGRIVYSHARPDHTWGGCGLPPVEVVASEGTAKEVAAEPPVELLRKILAVPDPARGGFPACMRRRFAFGFTGVTAPQPPTSIFDGRLELTAGDREIELLFLGPAHTGGDTVARLPQAGVAVHVGEAGQPAGGGRPFPPDVSPVVSRLPEAPREHRAGIYIRSLCASSRGDGLARFRGRSPSSQEDPRP